MHTHTCKHEIPFGNNLGYVSTGCVWEGRHNVMQNDGWSLKTTLKTTWKNLLVWLAINFTRVQARASYPMRWLPTPGCRFFHVVLVSFSKINRRHCVSPLKRTLSERTPNCYQKVCSCLHVCVHKYILSLCLLHMIKTNSKVLVTRECVRAYVRSCMCARVYVRMRICHACVYMWMILWICVYVPKAR